MKSVSVVPPTSFFFFKIIFAILIPLPFQILSSSSVLSRHGLGVLKDSVLTPPAWRRHQIPQIKGSVLQDCLTSAQSQVQVVTCAFT